jgi:signal transduction histidine kinase
VREVVDLHAGYASSAVAADFASLVSLACHDLRTPLATVSGFAKTLLRLERLDEEKAARYLHLIDAGSTELAELLELLSVAARIESGRYDPVTRDIDSLELARAAVPEATGVGVPVQVDVEAVRRGLASLALAAHRHGGVEVGVNVAGASVEIEPVTESAGPIVLAEELKDLGAAVAVRVVRALGGEVELEGERLTVTLPTATGATGAGP